MWNFLHLSLRVAAAIAGAFCLLTAFLSYPGEEGQMQSVLEDLWAKIDDRQKIALSLHAAFMQQVAKSVSRGFDLLFGHKLFSFRCLGVSISYSVSSVALTLIIAFVRVSFLEGSALSSKDLPMFALLGCILLVYLFIGTTPVLFPGFRFIKTWLLFILA